MKPWLLPVIFLPLLCSLFSADKPKVLFFTKSSGFQHPIIKVVNGKPSLAQGFLAPVADELGIEIVHSKDGGLISAENLKQYAAVIFYTSGDLGTVGKMDKAPIVTKQGKQDLLDAVASGKLGFIGIHSASDCYHTSKQKADRYKNDGDKLDPYLKLVGAEFIAHDKQEHAIIVNHDPQFPGNTFPRRSQQKNEWYSQKDFADNLHVILSLDGTGMVGPHYKRPEFPLVWARSYGKGRVFYTAFGHGRESWQNPDFINQLKGALRWVTGMVDADITPNIQKVTPQANVLPKPFVGKLPIPDDNNPPPFTP